MKILVTGGGTCEPIDSVRSISNFSTGKTASFLADFFCEKGFEATAAMAENAEKPGKAKILTYRTFSDLNTLLEKECRNSHFDAIIHAAAVSDYSVKEIFIDGKNFPAGAVSKIPSGKEILLKMQENPKILYSLKRWCGKNTAVVAFKLTSGTTAEEQLAAVKKIFSAENLSFQEKEFAPDFVVHNEKPEINGNAHPCKIFKNPGKILAETKTLQELAENLNLALRALLEGVGGNEVPTRGRLSLSI